MGEGADLALKNGHSTKVALVGAGKIGEAIVHLLGETGDYEMVVLDQSLERLASFAEKGLETRALDVSGPSSLQAHVSKCDVVLNAGPYLLTPAIALAARRGDAHYLDLTEDVESARAVAETAGKADTAFIPQCGLAPGFISIVATHLAEKFDELRDVQMRVGALPIYPTNTLKYNLTWSTDGLINEYCNWCDAIVDGKRVRTQALEELERFSLDGVDYEAFNTSGGLGTLCDTLQGRVQNLDYKTVRYPGHRDIVKTLIRDLRLGSRRDMLKDLLETALPITYQDVVLVFATVSGHRQGRLVQESYAKKIYSQVVNGRQLSAIQLTTAAGICAVLDLLVSGKIPRRGLVRQEEIGLELFLENRFGQYFA